MKTVLVIAGSDPSGWAGLQQDMGTLSDHGIRALTVVTALTAQNTEHVRRILPVEPGFVTSQIRTLLEEFDVHGVKIGMLGRVDTVRAIRRIIKAQGLPNIVLDPVIRASSGRRLIERNGTEEIKRLLPLVKVVTPNIYEAEVLSGVRIEDIGDMERSAERLVSMGVENAVIKGGHLGGEPVDVLYNGRRFYHYRGTRLRGEGRLFHGTGCIFSSALTAGIVKGKDIGQAVRDARRYLCSVLRGRGCVP